MLSPQEEAERFEVAAARFRERALRDPLMQSSLEEHCYYEMMEEHTSTNGSHSNGSNGVEKSDLTMSLSENTDPNDLTRWANYEFLPSPIIGFHGCDESVGEAILHGEVTHLELSRNDYDCWVQAFTSGKEIQSVPFNSPKSGPLADVIHVAKLPNLLCWERCSI